MLYAEGFSLVDYYLHTRLKKQSQCNRGDSQDHHEEHDDFFFRDTAVVVTSCWGPSIFRHHVEGGKEEYSLFKQQAIVPPLDSPRP